LNSYDVIIAGAGASGLAAGIFAARGGASILILEKNDRPARKLSATGNGRCNFTNQRMGAQYYRGTDPSFAGEVLSGFGVSETISFFQELGILAALEDGYAYPASFQAQSVVTALLSEASRLHVTLRTDTEITRIQRTDTGFSIEAGSDRFRSSCLILSCGSPAGAHASDSGLNLASSLGLSFRPFRPVLTGLTAQTANQTRFFPGAAGVRREGLIAAAGRQEAGEIQFTSYGISGIPVFQISSFLTDALEKQKEVPAVLDLCPFLSRDALTEEIHAIQRQNPAKSTEEALCGIINRKLACMLLKDVGIDPEAQLSVRDIPKMVSQIKQFRIEITGSNPMSQAQAAGGGILTSEICPETMEARHCPGLYVTGELLDIDGTCGGYNLQFAWSTGILAGRAAAKQSRKRSGTHDRKAEL